LRRVNARRWSALAILAAFVGGCGADPPPRAGTPAVSSAVSSVSSAAGDSWGDPAPAAAGGRSAPACDLPVTFDIAANWVPKPVDAQTAAVFGGPDRVACEVDGKPAGVLGFIRAYLATGPDARAALEAHVGRSSQASQPRFRQVTTSAGAGWEIAYRDEDSPVRAFAVPAGAGTVVVDWGGLDDEEHLAGLAAYVLARGSLARA
jgi:hypothetical protein